MQRQQQQTQQQQFQQQVIDKTVMMQRDISARAENTDTNLSNKGNRLFPTLLYTHTLTFDILKRLAATGRNKFNLD